MLYAAESDGSSYHRIRALIFAREEVFTATGGISGFGDTVGLQSATFDSISGITRSPDGRNLYVADTGNNRIRAVELSSRSMPPSDLAYTLPPNFQAGNAVSLEPTTRGGAVTSFTVSPDLPAGLVLSASGVIAGTPTGASASAAYTFTATGEGGFTTLVAFFGVVGATAQQSFTCIIDTDCSLVVEGIDLSTSSKIKVISNVVSCGMSSAPMEYSSTNGVGTTTSLSYTVKVSKMGTHRVCWWSGTGNDALSSYTTTTGQLSMIGPEAISHEAIINQPFALTIPSISGYSPTTANRIYIVASNIVCDATVTDDATVVDVPGTPTIDGTSSVFGGLRINAVGNYKICWKSGGPGSTFNTQGGTLNIVGPDPNQAFTIIINHRRRRPGHANDRWNVFSVWWLTDQRGG
jgi:hypothetical protein